MDLLCPDVTALLLLTNFMFSSRFRWKRIIGIMISAVLICILASVTVFMGETYAMLNNISGSGGTADASGPAADKVSVTEEPFNIYITGIDQWESEKGLDLAMVRSIDVGCRRITEKFLPGEGPASQDGVEAAHAFAREAFSVVSTWVDETGCVPEHLIVTGGTVTTIVALEKELVPYDSSQVHLATLTRGQADGLERRLAALSVEERAGLPGIQVKRAPVILGGVIAVGEVMRAAGFTELTVSESDLLVGLSITCACAAEGLETPVGWKPQLG